MLLTLCRCVQEAKDKQAKLAALHKWTHIDPEIPESVNLLRDDLLSGLIERFRSARGKKMPSSSAPPLFQDENNSDSDDEADVSVDTNKVASTVGSDDDEAEEMASGKSSPSKSSASKKRAAAAASPDWGVGEDSDANEVSESHVKKKRKTTQMGKGKSTRGQPHAKADMDETSPFSLEMPSAKYDLNAMEGGRITFLFEKISGSKL